MVSVPAGTIFADLMSTCPSSRRGVEGPTRLGHKTTVILVDPRNTSRMCHQCGHTAHADTNAARNILARALHHSSITNPGTPGDQTHPPHGNRVNHLTAA